MKPNDFVNNLLTSEEEGTLGEQLRKAGLVNGLTAFVNPDGYGTDGYLRIHADLTDLGIKNQDKVISSIFAYVNLVKTQGAKEIYFRELKAMRAKDFENATKPDPLSQAIAVTMNQFDLPIENVIDAEFIYESFDQNAINNLLAQLQPENARIWYINKAENVQTTIPFFGGKYDVRDITSEQQSRWAVEAAKIQFKLPPPNNLFTDKPADIVDNVYKKPQKIVSQKGVEAFLAHPEFYREDKGVLVLELNVDFAQKTARNVVLSEIVSDIYKNKNTTIIDRAARASLEIDIKPSVTNSQEINISGYTTKHEELLGQLLDDYANLKVENKDFIEALDRYKLNKANAKKAPPFRQLFAHSRRIVGGVKWTDTQLLDAAGNIKLKDVIEYHKLTKVNPLIRMYAFGNYTEDYVKHMAKIASQKLPGSRIPEQRQLAKYITPKNSSVLTYNETIEQTDSALLDAYFGDIRSDEGKAQLVVLQAVLGNVFFSQLRTNEQLGYVVGSAPFSFDDYPGFALYVQSTNTDLPRIKARIDKFRDEFLAQLKALDPAQIEQIKKAEAANVLQKPTDLYAEASRYAGDFWKAQYDFSARERYLAALEKVNKDDLIALYRKMLLDKKSMNLLVQLKGTTFSGKPYAK
ncbi:MAG: hypothetical protein EOO68_08835 [Moraxellaceae bacterium]|nr:MAG: hypothetical protein EOO68_08835 [Moraxellaceae bacterium]